MLESEWLLWGFGVLGFWGFGVLGFWGFGVLGFVLVGSPVNFMLIGGDSGGFGYFGC